MKDIPARSSSDDTDDAVSTPEAPAEEQHGLAAFGDEIVGGWVETESGEVRRDESATLIRKLTARGGRFHKLAATGGGWEVLYRDPVDGRLWEKTFPQGHLHGGGPPALRVLSEKGAREKYGRDAFAPTTS